MRPTPSQPLMRSHAGRWLGGVCAGLALSRGLRPGWIRGAFVIASLAAGLGIVAYLACWLIIPQEGEAPDQAESRWIVGLAQACAALVALVSLAALAAAATLFGFGWIVVALAAVVLVAALLWWPRLGPAWALLPVAALTVPSLAVAASGLRLSPQTSIVRFAPPSLSAAARTTYRGGLGAMLIDLRRTALPASGEVTLSVQGGLRRTIVALPEDRCVHVVVSVHMHPFVTQAAAQLTRRLPFPGIVGFGQIVGPRRTLAFASGPASGPVLRIDFTSLGASLYVRDYPDSVNPDANPYWPGFQVIPEPRPDTRGLRKRAARRLIAAWRVRRADQVHSRALIDPLLAGPCWATGTSG